MIGLQNIQIYKSCSEAFKDSPPSFLYTTVKKDSERVDCNKAPPLPLFFYLVAQMNSYTNILEKTRNMVSGYMSGLDPSHDMYHVDRVTNLGMCCLLETVARGN